MPNQFLFKPLVVCIYFLLSSLALPVLAGPTVTVYSARKEHLIKPVFEQFTKETGIAVQYRTDNAPALLAKIQQEGKKTAADLYLTVDAGNLWQATKKGILAPINSPVLKKNIPAHLRDPEGRWFGLSVRARTIVFSTKRVKKSQLSTYEDLASPRWKGKLCLRTAKKVYNQSLVAMLIAELGEAEAAKIVGGWIENLATKVFSDDTSLIKAVASGRCDVGIVNTYYLGRLLAKQADFPVGIFWPNQQSSGVHVNVSGAGVVKHAKNQQEAQKLLEWLAGKSAQGLFAGLNLEYPVHPKVEAAPLVKAWGAFKQNQLNLANAGSKQSAAIKLMDRVKYH